MLKFMNMLRSSGHLFRDSRISVTEFHQATRAPCQELCSGGPSSALRAGRLPIIRRYRGTGRSYGAFERGGGSVLRSWP
jgi:hypothetical protein